MGPWEAAWAVLRAGFIPWSMGQAAGWPTGAKYAIKLISAWRLAGELTAVVRDLQKTRQPWRSRCRALRNRDNVMPEMRGTVLIVDPEPVSRRSLTLALRTWGYTVYQAMDGEKALELYRLHAPALVVTELVGSRLNGLELLRRLRLEDPDAVVVVLTSRATMDDAKTAMRGGATDFLTKPADYARLKALLEKSLPARGVAPGELMEVAQV